MRTALNWVQDWLEDRKASRRFADILSDCLERVEAGEDIHRCADAYPEHKDELLPLLRVAAATRAASTPYQAKEASRKKPAPRSISTIPAP